MEKTVHPRQYPLFQSVVSDSRVARMEEGGAALPALHWRMVRRENLVDHNLEYHPVYRNGIALVPKIEPSGSALEAPGYKKTHD